jgi:hypothetical protein
MPLPPPRQPMTRDTSCDHCDEWRTQHENLLSVRQSDLALLEQRTELLRATLAYLPSTLGIAQRIRGALGPHVDLPKARGDSDR